MAHENSSPLDRNLPNGKLAGIIIAVCAGLSIPAIANHPQILARSHGDLLAQIVALSPIDRFVHGALMVIMFALVWGLAIFAIRRGFNRATVLAGFIAYAAGALAWIGATLIDGFITPEIAARFIGTSPEAQNYAISLLRFCAISIQILTKFGLVAISIGILKWSAGLLLSPGAPRTVGVIGIFAGILPPVIVLLTHISLSPHSLGIIIITQAVWYAGIATLLIRERV